jgi:hypothetical protein
LLSLKPDQLAGSLTLLVLPGQGGVALGRERPGFHFGQGGQAIPGRLHCRPVGGVPRIAGEKALYLKA